MSRVCSVVRMKAPYLLKQWPTSVSNKITYVIIIAASQLQVAVKLKNLGCYEISLGDTIGVGTPGRIYV